MHVIMQLSQLCNFYLMDVIMHLYSYVCNCVSVLRCMSIMQLYPLCIFIQDDREEKSKVARQEALAQDEKNQELVEVEEKQFQVSVSCN